MELSESSDLGFVRSGIFGLWQIVEDGGSNTNQGELGHTARQSPSTIAASQSNAQADHPSIDPFS
jgi:hypothetical protein